MSLNRLVVSFDRYVNYCYLWSVCGIFPGHLPIYYDSKGGESDRLSCYVFNIGYFT